MQIAYDNGTYSSGLPGPLGARIDQQLNAANSPEGRAWFDTNVQLPMIVDPQDTEAVEHAYESWLSSRVEQIAHGFRITTKHVPAEYRVACLDLLGDDQQANVIRRWSQDGESKTLILHGPAGTGKTFAAYALLNEAAVTYGEDRKVRRQDRGPWPELKYYPPTATSVASMLDRLRGDGDEAFWEQVKKADLLVLDDLGHVRSTEWAVERMWMLADARCSEGRRTVVTTNASFTDLAEAWSLATMDRFRDRCVTAKFTGASRRKPVTW